MTPAHSSNTRGAARGGGVLRGSTATFVAALLLVMSAPARAAVAEVPSVEALAAAADRALVGSVVAIRSAWNEDRSLIISKVTARVAEVLVGRDPGAEVVVRVPGGLLPEEDLGMAVAGAAEFQVGDEVVVFLRRGNAPGSIQREAMPAAPFYRVLNGEPGKFTVVQDPQGLAKQAVRDISAAVGRGPGDAERMSLDTLRGLIRVARGSGGQYDAIP